MNYKKCCLWSLKTKFYLISTYIQIFSSKYDFSISIFFGCFVVVLSDLTMHINNHYARLHITKAVILNLHIFCIQESF